MWPVAKQLLQCFANQKDCISSATVTRASHQKRMVRVATAGVVRTGYDPDDPAHPPLNFDDPNTIVPFTPAGGGELQCFWLRPIDPHCLTNSEPRRAPLTLCSMPVLRAHTDN